MGLSLSILLSAWNRILNHKCFGIAGTIEAVVTRSMSFERKDGDVPLRTKSFKRVDSQTDKSDKNMEIERSLSFKTWDSKESKPIDQKRSASISSTGGNLQSIQIVKPTIKLPEKVVFFSPRPVSELDDAATKLQKVYKSYRTRRNLADCAVVVEELWWKALDFAALKRCSVSFFDDEKQETAASRWARARTKAAKVGKGLSKDEKAQKLALQHWLEAIDPRHRYGHNLHFYYDVWSASKSTQPFFYWLDIGDGKELNLEKCPKSVLHRQCIKYLGPKEREEFEVIVESGKLVYKQSGMLVNSTEGSKSIFVLSTSRALYVGQKKKGVFQHSSFLSGGAITAAGRLVAHDGFLEAIWPYSGHYLPTEDNFKEFISFLEENNVDLSNVKRCAVDDENASYTIIGDKESMSKEIKDVSAAAMSTNAGAVDNQQEAIIMVSSSTNTVPPVFDLTKRLSCKWTSGVGPRIGCVRDYPTELQSQALEQVNLSPKVMTPARLPPCAPIPSPRPSPKILVSPRLAYMGLPSPRTPVVNAAC